MNPKHFILPLIFGTSLKQPKRLPPLYQLQEVTAVCHLALDWPEGHLSLPKNSRDLFRFTFRAK